MTTLAKGVCDIKDAKATSIIQIVIRELRNMLDNHGSFIKTSAINNALQDLTFDYHPSEVSRRNLQL